MKTFKVCHDDNSSLNTRHFTIALEFSAPSIWAAQLNCFDIFCEVDDGHYETICLATHFKKSSGSDENTIISNYLLAHDSVSLKEPEKKVTFELRLKPSIINDTRFYAWWFKQNAWEFIDEIKLTLLITTNSKKTINSDFSSLNKSVMKLLPKKNDSSSHPTTIFNGADFNQLLSEFQLLNSLPQKIQTSCHDSTITFSLNDDHQPTKLGAINEFIDSIINQRIHDFKQSAINCGFELEIKQNPRDKLTYDVTIVNGQSPYYCGKLPMIDNQPFLPLSSDAIMWFDSLDIEADHLQNAVNTRQFNQPIELTQRAHDKTFIFSCNVATFDIGDATAELKLPHFDEVVTCQYPSTGELDLSKLSISIESYGQEHVLKGQYIHVKLTILEKHIDTLLTPEHNLRLELFDGLHGWADELKQWLGDKNRVIKAEKALQSWTALCFDIGTSSMTMKIHRQDPYNNKHRNGPVKLVDTSQKIEKDHNQCPVILMPYSIADDQTSLFPIIDDEELYKESGEGQYSAVVLRNIKNLLRSNFEAHLPISYKKLYNNIGEPVVTKSTNVGLLAKYAYQAMLKLDPLHDKSAQTIKLTPHTMAAVTQAKDEITHISFAIPNSKPTAQLHDFINELSEDIIDHYGLTFVNNSKEKVVSLVSESKAALLYEINNNRSALLNAIDHNGKVDTVIFDIGAGTADITFARITINNTNRLQVELVANTSSDLAGNFFDFLIAQSLFEQVMSKQFVNTEAITKALDNTLYHDEYKKLGELQLQQATDYILLTMLNLLLQNNNQHCLWQINNTELNEGDMFYFYDPDLDAQFFGKNPKTADVSMIIDSDNDEQIASFLTKVLSHRESQQTCLIQLISCIKNNQRLAIKGFAFGFILDATTNEINITLHNSENQHHYFEPSDNKNISLLSDKLPIIKNHFTQDLEARTEKTLIKLLTAIENQTTAVFNQTNNNSTDEDMPSPMEWISQSSSYNPEDVDKLSKKKEFFTELKDIAKILKETGQYNWQDTASRNDKKQYEAIARFHQDSHTIDALLDQTITIPIGHFEKDKGKTQTLKQWINDVSVSQVEQLLLLTQNLEFRQPDTQFDLDWLILTGRGGQWSPLKKQLKTYFARNKTEVNNLADLTNKKDITFSGLFKKDYTIEDAKYSVIEGLAQYKYWGDSPSANENRDSMYHANKTVGLNYYIAIRHGTTFTSLARLVATEAPIEVHKDDDIEIFCSTESWSENDKNDRRGEVFYYNAIKNKIVTRTDSKVTKIIVKNVNDELKITSNFRQEVFDDHERFRIVATPALQLASFPDNKHEVK